MVNVAAEPKDQQSLFLGNESILLTPNFGHVSVTRLDAIVPVVLSHQDRGI